MTIIKKLLVSAVATFLLADAGAQAAQASSYPGSRPVSIVVGFSAGGSTDMLARLLAKELAAEMHGTFVVENRAGANSNIANSYVARAAPDGYTLLMVPFGLPVNQYLYQQLSYDFKKDFAPVALVAKVPNVIVVGANAPWQSVKNLVDHASAQEVTYSTPGVGSSLHLAGELFRYETKARMLHIPYKGSAPSMAAVMAGETDSAFENLSTAAPLFTSGKLRALAVTSKLRSASFPDIPTVAESGFPGYEINSYFGVAAPAGTPPEIVQRLNAAVIKALGKPEMHEYLSNLGAAMEPYTPEEFGEFLRAEGKRWGPVIKSAGIASN